MDIVRASIDKPVTVIVGVILVVMFGAIALVGMPYQLSPTVTTPEITVTTYWTGATPYEIERDIVEEQEKVLKGVTGLEEMESECFNGFARITLRFELGTDVDDALLRVSNKMNEVRITPEGAEKPVISATGSNTSPVVWTMLKTLPGNPRHIATYQTYFENEVRQYLERVDGVAELFVGGGTEDEMHVVVEPEKLASYGLTVSDVMSVLREENVNVSAGTLGLGRRDYRIRTVAQFQSPRVIEELVLTSTGQRTVHLRDVGRVLPGYAKEQAVIMVNAEPGIVVAIRPEPGANVLELTDKAEAVVKELNAGKLKEQGLYIDWNYDQRAYIRGAIDLVRQNILIGGLLAVVVLLVFLQSGRATLIVAAAIPISVVGSFIFLSVLGRTMNVVSMAGISFAVGMLVDNAIVVLENIDRHRSMGKSSFDAAYDGAKEVWGAVLASTLTTVAVFLPVVFVQEEAGQLFKDIAIAVTCAILLSMLVSITVIPMMARYLYGSAKKAKSRLLAPLTAVGDRLAGGLMALVRLTLTSVFTRIATVDTLTAVSMLIVWLFFPKMEYLPTGNRNLLINILIPPPGLSIEERKDMGRQVYTQLEPHMMQDHAGFPGVHTAFFVSAPQINIIGATSTDEQGAARLIPLFSRITNSIPGMIGVSLQASIFEQRIGTGRAISLDLTGPDLNRLITVGGAMFGMIQQAIPGCQVRPVPSLEMLYPEVVFTPLRERVKAAGLTADGLGLALDVFMDGRKVGDYKQEGRKTIDLVLKGEDKGATTPEDLYSALVSTPGGRAVPVSFLAELQRTYGITQIRHLERQRAITLEITPPADTPLQQAMETLENQIIPAVRQQGLLANVDVGMSGAADKLSVTRQALQWNFLLALVITYLLMAALFGNFIYPLIILFTVPLAGAGGFLGLKLENWFIAPQPMDILTMLGFVILVGVVVNNAILIVHQSLNNIREHGMEHREAVLESVRTRIRPIYMSATTSIFGMLPLAIAPGPGSELYRGLGSVVLGGLAISTIFTIFVIPSLLMFFIGMEKRGLQAG
ncbi:MAG: efflux RND transporter permease subunit [Desulfocurvibacter africanus]